MKRLNYLLILSLLSISYIGTSNLSAQQKDSQNSVGNLVEQSFQGLGLQLLTDGRISNHPNSNHNYFSYGAGASVGNTDKSKEHYHHKIEIGMRCPGIPTNKYVDKEGKERSCGLTLGLNYQVADGPHSGGPFCSCEDKCSKVKIEYLKLIMDNLKNHQLGDISNCYDCSSPNGPWCNEKEKEPQPGGCGDLSQGTLGQNNY